MEKIVQRTCIGCNAKKDKKSLIRIVINNKEIDIDKTGKLEGRGAYICDNIDCLEKSIKRKRFERTFNMQIKEEVYNKLKSLILEKKN